MANETKNVFISHLHEAKDPEYIKREILAPRIAWASTLIVYITPNTRDSDWVNWEIEYAEKLGKRIVGVWAHGASEADLPEALDKYANAVVGWNSDKIIDAVNGETQEWRTSTGDMRPQRPIMRYSCR